MKKTIQLSTIHWVLGAALVLLPGVWPHLSYSKERPSSTAAAASIVWNKDLEAALQLAKKENKRVLVRFTADWCPPCRIMASNSWPSDEVVKAVKQDWIPVLLDVDQPSSQSAAEGYGIASIPTILAVDSEGKELARSGFMSASKLEKFLSKASRL